jgi:membrane-bound lytic murein transglycosylase D
MSNAYRAWILGLTLLGAATTTLADDDAFPHPESLEPAVHFWTRVYTEIDTHSGFIHDSLDLSVVYATIQLPDDISRRERRRRVERGIHTYRDILTKLARGARTDLSSEEQRVLNLFPDDVDNRELRAAAHRLRFQLGQSDRFRAGLVRSGAWKPYIYSVLDKHGLPRELAALPHVESSFDPTAYSKVGAAGLWQFTRSTGLRYMQIDHIVDERRDPFLATQAAARLLEDNYSVLQSWPLALTAYNHGLAGMRRAVSLERTTDIDAIVDNYQSRTFGFASRNFYAAFLAALEIDSHPEKYFGAIQLDPPSDTDVAKVPDYVPAKALARALNMRESALRDLNPALQDSVWAGDKLVPRGFELRLPRSTAAVAEELMAGIGQDERFAEQRPDVQHRVRRGDTLSEIAAEYHVSLAALMRMNGLGPRDLIRVGQVISLPVNGNSAAAVLAANRPEPAASPDDQRSYTVERGDSIERIAKRFGVDAQALLAANSVGDRNLIYAGQQLRIPGGSDVVEPTAVLADSGDDVALAAVADGTAADDAVANDAVANDTVTDGSAAAAATDDGAELDTAEIEAAQTTALPDHGEAAAGDDDADSDADDVNALASTQDDLAADPSDYSVAEDGRIEVQSLETLGHYADWLDIRTQRLRDINHMPFHEAVVIGQKLKLDFSHVDAATFEQRRVAYQKERQSEFFAAYRIADIDNHVVKPGESLWILAAHRYKVPVWLLRQYNPDLDLDHVQPGTVVKFPRLRAVDADDSGGDHSVDTVASSGN